MTPSRRDSRSLVKQLSRPTDPKHARSHPDPPARRRELDLKIYFYVYVDGSRDASKSFRILFGFSNGRDELLGTAIDL